MLLLRKERPEYSGNVKNLWTNVSQLTSQVSQLQVTGLQYYSRDNM